MFCFLIYKYFKIVELFVIMEVPEEISMYIKQITTQYWRDRKGDRVQLTTLHCSLWEAILKPLTLFSHFL